MFLWYFVIIMLGVPENVTVSDWVSEIARSVLLTVMTGVPVEESLKKNVAAPFVRVIVVVSDQGLERTENSPEPLEQERTAVSVQDAVLPSPSLAMTVMAADSAAVMENGTDTISRLDGVTYKASVSG